MEPRDPTFEVEGICYSMLSLMIITCSTLEPEELEHAMLSPWRFGHPIMGLEEATFDILNHGRVGHPK